MQLLRRMIICRCFENVMLIPHGAGDRGWHDAAGPLTKLCAALYPKTNNNLEAGAYHLSFSKDGAAACPMLLLALSTARPVLLHPYAKAFQAYTLFAKTQFPERPP
jgi:hypothetical protein